MGIKLYGVTDSPPTLAVRMALKYLGQDYEYINIDYGNGEQVSAEFRKKNPQGEIPVLDDNGLILGESCAILQYLADKYRKDETFYPVEPSKRAIVNHRLAFNMTTYYKAIIEYVILPLCYAYRRTDLNLKKLKHSLNLFEEYFNRTNTAFVASDNLTIADLSLMTATMCLEVIGMDLTPYPKVKQWYDGFKINQKDLWVNAGVENGLEELKEFEKNPPNLSHVNHPIHPTDKTQLA